MRTIADLYDLFEIKPNCSDEELRRAYRKAMLQNHPDMNPDNIDVATIATQELNKAYATLKNFRHHGISIDQMDAKDIDFEYDETITIHIVFEYKSVDIEDIARRKSSFRLAWENFQKNQSDTFNALRLIHAACQAERLDAIHNLLLNPIIIDSAPLLLNIIQKKDAIHTILRWADLIYDAGFILEAIQILQEVVSTEDKNPEISDRLRSFHYRYVQGYTPKGKPEPQERIEHLNRILDLGFQLDYIYKLLAEAYHDLGDDEQARIHLKHAYKINPSLSGAIRISRALGLLPRQPKPRKRTKRRKYKYNQLDQIPSSGQIRDWASSGKWSEILSFADISQYSPGIIPKSRNRIRQLAVSLGFYNTQKSRDILEKFLDSVYWDIREASILSLSEIGNRQTLKLLRSYVPRNTSDSVALKEAIPFLESRLEHTHSVIPKDPVSELFHKAEELFENDDYGKARLLLESLLSSMGRSHNLYSKTLLLLARSCGEMGKTNKAIELIIPEFRDLPIGMREGIADDLTNWLWSELVFENYDPSNDQLYIYAINLQLDLALKSTSPDDVLSNIRSLTRWMEIIGNDDIAQWIRALIRTEAPGTLYVDKDDRSRYVRDVEISEELRLALSDFQNRLKDEVPIKLRQVLGGGKDLQRKKSKLYLLGD